MKNISLTDGYSGFLEPGCGPAVDKNSRTRLRKKASKSQKVSKHSQIQVLSITVGIYNN
jgi:hypothetical protein